MPLASMASCSAAASVAVAGRTVAPGITGIWGAAVRSRVKTVPSRSGSARRRGPPMPATLPSRTHAASNTWHTARYSVAGQAPVERDLSHLHLLRVTQSIAPQSWAVDSGGKGGRQQRRPGIGGGMGGIMSVPREHDEGRADGACCADRGGSTRPILGARQRRVGMAHDILRVHVERPASVLATAGITCLWLGGVLVRQAGLGCRAIMSLGDAYLHLVIRAGNPYLRPGSGNDQGR